MDDRDTSAAQAEVAQLVSELIAIDSSNYGNDEGPGEVAAADYVFQRLVEVGLEPERYSTTSDRRQGVVVRLPGRDRTRGALLLHGHLDVVPAPEPNWIHPAFAGVIDEDEYVWGRGAVDMKDMDGMMLAVIRDWARNGVQPERDIVALWLPDEEAGGTHGSGWLVDNRPDIFEGVTEAVGEVGGVSITLRDDLRMYPIQTAEKGIAWLRLIAEGKAGHGSFIAEDNPVIRLCEAATRIGAYKFPVELTPAASEFLQRIEDLTGIELDLEDVDDVTARLGSIGRIIGATVRNTANVTMLDAGYKANVIPEAATAVVDGRFLPGAREQFLETMKTLIGDGIRVEEIENARAVETTFDGPLVDGMAAALRANDSAAVPVPYLMSGGTDAKAFDRLGIRSFGFSPLLLPPEVDFFGMFHAVNERVPVSALKFGVRVLDRFLLAA